MPAVPTTGSDNIVSLDSRIYADLCGGNFLIDTSPTVYLEGGASTSGGVQGASIRITNPVGVVIRNYPTSGFDIYPPMTSVFSYPIPIIAGIYGYGTYTIDVRMTDHDGESWTVSKPVNICPPDPDNNKRNYGCLGATIQGNCQTGELIVILNAPPNYKGVAFTSQVNDLELEYPTASGLSPLETTLSSFSVQLYEGQYILTGTVCVLYNYGDYVYFYINYKVKCEKIIRCVIDECCVSEKLNELRLRVKSDCTQAQKDETFAILVEGTALFALAKMQASCGEDPSDTLGDLEKLLGCQCTCNCNEGTPVVGTFVGADYIYRGLLTQVGTNAPTAQIGQFNKVTIVWTYVSVGLYQGTITGLTSDLTVNNTFILINAESTLLLTPYSVNHIKARWVSANTIYVFTTDAAGTAANSILLNTAIQISLLS